MAKSSSIYMGEGKMALSGKWGSAFSACMVAMAVTMVPSFIEPLIVDPSTQTFTSSSSKIFYFIFSLAWAFCVSYPLLFACIVGLRQMHISNESPLDAMIEKFKNNISRYIVLELKIALRILTFISIPLAIYLICLFKGYMEYGDLTPSSQYGGIATLSMTALVIVYIYKSLEFTFVPFIHNDNPDMTDNDILNKSSQLSKGYKWTMFKIMLRAILPAFVIIFVLIIAFICVYLGLAIGGLVALGAGYNITDIPSSQFGMMLGMTYFFVFTIIILLFGGFIYTRMILPFSVLYSELTGYNNNTQNSQENTPAIVESSDSEKNKENAKNEEEKKEEKKDEPEIPYEQRYMPK